MQQSSLLRPEERTLLNVLRRVLLGLLVALVVATVLAYIGDAISVRLRMRHPTATDPFETITALRILAIGEKGNKTEFTVDPVQPQQAAECVHALFPHAGDPPCWYLKRKFAQPIPMALLFLPRSAH